MTEIGAVQKNSDGHLGERCNNCAGYGFTNLVTGGALACSDCNRTGVKGK